MDKPILDNRFTIAAGNGNEGISVLLAMIGSNTLESLDNIIHMPNIGVRIGGLKVDRDNKRTDTFAVEAINIAATGVARGRNGKKQSALRFKQAATVGEEMLDFLMRQRQLD